MSINIEKMSAIIDIKERLAMSDIVSRYTNESIVECGSWMELESRECPFCGAHDAFRINPEDTYFRCFSCDRSGDVIDFVGKLTKKSFSAVIEELRHVE